jgi:hypothetical protein
MVIEKSIWNTPPLPQPPAAESAEIMLEESGSSGAVETS